ncbi:GDP-L-fucose synthase [Bradyrhizobium sp. ARR65]|uniref:GDP-L-fucose synthase family protein n=1 Tax=Bradyrhizobium sp. ARR65 TaxID=1040989 RepID=UPI0032DE7475
MTPKKVFVAGDSGLVGSATLHALRKRGCYDVITCPHERLDLEDRQATYDFFMRSQPNYVVMCAAKVGGILANSTYPVDFLHKNLRIQLNVFDAAYASNVDRMIFLGSSCIYPRDCPQPIREEYILTGPLELTNRAYALAKISGVEACQSFNRQFGTNYLALMPTNLYGPGDNYHPQNSHVIPALIRRFHAAKQKSVPSVVVWGSGRPRREFMFSLDLGDAIAHLLGLPDEAFKRLTCPDVAPLLNIGVGQDMTIAEIASLIRSIVGYEGEIEFDISKPDGTPRKLLDTSKMSRLGWRAVTGINAGLALAYEDFLRKSVGN